MQHERSGSSPTPPEEGISFTLSTVTVPNSSLRREDILSSTASSIFSLVRGSSTKYWQVHWACIWMEQCCRPIRGLGEKCKATSSTVASLKSLSRTLCTTSSTISSAFSTSFVETSKNLS